MTPFHHCCISNMSPPSSDHYPLALRLTLHHSDTTNETLSWVYHSITAFHWVLFASSSLQINTLPAGEATHRNASQISRANRAILASWHPIHPISQLSEGQEESVEKSIIEALSHFNREWSICLCRQEFSERCRARGKCVLANTLSSVLDIMVTAGLSVLDISFITSTQADTREGNWNPIKTTSWSVHDISWGRCK